MLDAVHRVAVALPRPLPMPFDYRIAPDAAASPLRGCRLRVPLGHGETIGIAIDEAHASGSDPAALKPVLERIDATPILAGELWSSLTWLARYLHAPLG